MPRKCAVIKCGAMERKTDTGFYKIPKGDLAREVLRRKLWISAVNLKVEHKEDFVCGQHFHSGKKYNKSNWIYKPIFILKTGKPASPNDISNIDWVPSINLNPVDTSLDSSSCNI